MRAVTFVKIIILIMCTQVLAANADVVEFSATAVQQAPRMPASVSQMYVSKEAVRREFTHNNQDFAEIYYPRKGIHYLITPANKTYQIEKSPPNLAVLRGQKIKSTNPCTDKVKESCKLLAEEDVNGQQADKWEVSRDVDGRTLKALIWVDKRRGQVLRQFYPDGTVIELVQTGKMRINERDTERWELQTKAPQGRTEKTVQWYDPELEMTIKEVLPGGFIRELKNIKTGKQPDDLFKIPSDYREAQPRKDENNR